MKLKVPYKEKLIYLTEVNCYPDLEQINKKYNGRYSLIHDKWFINDSPNHYYRHNLSENSFNILCDDERFINKNVHFYYLIIDGSLKRHETIIVKNFTKEELMIEEIIK